MLRPIADEFDVSLGTSGWVSTAQLAGFVIGSWTAGRHLRPVRKVFITLALLGFIANLCAAAAPNLAVLATARFAGGISLGLAAWFAWQDAFGNADKTSDVAVVGPLVGIVLPPALTVIIDSLGVRVMFIVLAVIALSPVLFAAQVDVKDRLRPHRTRHSATRASIAMLVALGLLTMGGSSVFVYAAAIGTEYNGLDPIAVSLAFSANALVAVPAARWKGRRGPAGMWYIATAVLAFVLPAVHIAPIFVIALIAWGFVFFMGMPAAFALLASHSRFPEERAGETADRRCVHRHRSNDADGYRGVVDHVLRRRADALHRPRPLHQPPGDGVSDQRRVRMRKLPVTDVSTKSPDSIAGR